MAARVRLRAMVARQLGHPGGLLGRLVGALLNRRNASAVAASVEALALHPGAVVADVGFGGGVGLARLLERVGTTGTVHGVEVSSEMLIRAKRRLAAEMTAGRVRLHQASMTALPFENGSLDAIITTNTVYFVSDSELDRALRGFARALKPSGRAVIGITDPEAMAAMSVTAHGFRLRSVDEVVRAIEHADLVLDGHRRLGRGSRAFHALLAAPR